MAKICDGRCWSRGPILTIYNTSLFLFKTNILVFVSSKSVKINSSYRVHKFRTKRISKIFANGGPIGLIFGTSCFLVKHYRHTEFHSNRSRTRHSCHTKHKSYDQSSAMVTAEVVVRFCPFTIPAYSSSIPGFCFIKIGQDLLELSCRQIFGYSGQRTADSGQRTAYTLTMTPLKIDENVF